jgi:hypothetical protein
MRVCRCGRFGLLLAVAWLTLTACGATLPDRHSQVNQLTRQLRSMPGVDVTSNTFDDDAAHGPVFFEVDVDVVDNVTGDQLAAITSAYLADLQAQDYRGYRTRLEVRRGDSAFVVDTGSRPVSNRDQILAQAHSWAALRQQFAGSTVKLRAAVGHAGDAPPVTSGSIELPDAADYLTVGAAVGTLATGFADLAAGDWKISAGKQHPAEIRTSRRLPTRQEMELWNALNADQAIPHADVFTVNGAVTGPFWVSERIADDGRDMAGDVALDLAVRLAQRHLPIVARLPAPVLYTATNQYVGHLDFRGQAMAPVAILIGGCMKRNYRPSPAEQALINQYENCRR